MGRGSTKNLSPLIHIIKGDFPLNTMKTNKKKNEET